MSASTRLYVLLARRSPLAVIFRRGPSRYVQLVQWDRQADVFTPGQWFKGRIYERRCDLSPSGKYLIYFAAKFNPRPKEDYYSWTAISRPPYLTALALWPKEDTWGGGGMFQDERRILLNHKEQDRELGEGFRVGGGMRMLPIGDWAGRGEDSPIADVREARDGWKVIQSGKGQRLSMRKRKLAGMSFVYDEPRVMSKISESGDDGGLELQMHLLGYHEIDGSQYVCQYMVKDKEGKQVLDLGRCDWSDWDLNGDLLFSRGGKLMRVKKQGSELSKPIELVDLSGSTFEAVEAPAYVKEW